MSEVASKKKHVIIVAAGAFVVVVFVVFFLSSFGGKQVHQSSLPQVKSGVRQTSAMTPSYEQNIHDYNDKRAFEAEMKGNSALPVLTPKTEKHPDEVAPADANSRQEVYKERQLNQVMHKEMMALKDFWAPPASVSEQYALSSYKDEDAKGSAARKSEAVPVQGKKARRVVDAGTQLAGVTDSVVNTDDKMPAFVSVVDFGHLKGAKFACKVSRRDERVAIICDRMTFAGKTYKANAVVLDLNTGRAVLSGDVDRKLMARYGWPFLAAMASGYGKLMATPNTTSLTIGTAGVTSISEKPSTNNIMAGAVGAGADALSREMTKSKSAEISVEIPEKTPVSIYLLDSILDDGTPAPEVMFEDSGVNSNRQVIQVPQLPPQPQVQLPASVLAMPMQQQFN